MKLKKILHIIDSLQIGGAEKLLCNTIAELTGFEHLIVTLFPGKTNNLLPPNANYICLDARKITDVPSKRKLYKRILKDYKPDIIHSHLYFATVFAKWLSPSSVPLIFTQHFEFSKNAEKWYYRLVDRVLSKPAHNCIAVSNIVLQDYLHTTSFKGTTQIINNYIPEKYFNGTKKEIHKEKKLKLVSLGNIKAIKNQQFILDAFKFLKDLDVQCDIYGEGFQRLEMDQQAQDNHLPIFFKGEIPDSSIILSNYDLYIMPSLTEGFPLALFEAMASGLPVVVSDIPAFHELLGDECNYVSLSDPSSLRPVITKYFSNPYLLKNDGEKMRAVAMEKANKEIYLGKIIKLYEQLANGNGLNN
jgi:glycosyltransferase involved in cell wall biosynthesis